VDGDVIYLSVKLLKSLTGIKSRSLNIYYDDDIIYITATVINIDKGVKVSVVSPYISTIIDIELFDTKNVFVRKFLRRINKDYQESV